MEPDDVEAAAGLIAVADGLSRIIELAAGHRERAKAQGFTEEAAEEMAIQVHCKLVELISSNPPASRTP